MLFGPEIVIAQAAVECRNVRQLFVLVNYIS